MRKIINSPGKYIQGENEMKHLEEYYAILGNTTAYMIVDQYIYENYKSDIVSSFESKNRSYDLVVFGGECCKGEIKCHVEKIKENGNDAVIGIGGGKTLDTAKAVSFYLNIPVIIVPTAASSDAPCSNLSVVYTEEGEFEEYLFLRSNPNMVIMDTEIIAKAPVRLLAAGIGDALATYYEASACAKSNAITIAGAHSTKTAIALAELCLETLLEDGYKAVKAVENKVCTMAVENIIEANTYLSGIGFESGGLSGAHAIHNGLTVLKECHHMLHGEKVAFGTITQMVLENRTSEELERIILFCKKIGLPTSFEELGLKDICDEELFKAAEASVAENDTMGNMPFAVDARSVFSAMKAANALSLDLDE